MSQCSISFTYEPIHFVRFACRDYCWKDETLDAVPLITAKSRCVKAEFHQSIVYLISVLGRYRHASYQVVAWVLF